MITGTRLSRRAAEETILCHSFIDFYRSKKKTIKLNYFYIYTNLYLRILLTKSHMESFRQDGFHTFIKLIMGLVVITILIPRVAADFPFRKVPK